MGTIAPIQGTFPRNPSQAAALLGLPIDVKRDYGASGSAETTTGSIASGSTTLTLASAIDFQNGQGISVANAGPLPTIAAPTAATATPEGTAGTTTIDYAVAALDANGGVTASFAFSTTTANATLSATNYVSLSVTAVTSASAYAWWRTSTNGTSPTTTGLIGISAGTALNDTGLATFAPPTGIPGSAPSAALGGPLVASIVSGAATDTALLSLAASSTVAGASVLHDDTAAFMAAADAGGLIYVQPGTYNVSSTVTLNLEGTCSTERIRRSNGSSAAHA